MSHCGNGNIDWKLVASVPNGPNTDHTSLPSGNNTPSPGKAVKKRSMKIMILLLKLRHVGALNNLTHKTHIFDNTTPGRVGAHFMHASTKAAGLGDSARLETSRMMPSGMCNVQCLQFYYFHSGNHADQLNIWLREFRSESDQTGTNRLVKQITGNMETAAFGTTCSVLSRNIEQSQKCCSYRHENKSLADCTRSSECHQTVPGGVRGA